MVFFISVVDLVLYQLLANSFYRAARKMRTFGFSLSSKPSNQTCSFPNIAKCDVQGRNRMSQTVVCDILGVILKTDSFFPFFMLVAFEGGNILRAFLLLMSCPFLMVCDHEMRIKVMTFITFCGLRIKDMENVSRAVLPKFYLENLNAHVCDILASIGSKVVITNVPRVMVEGFLKEYLSVSDVIGTELHAVGGYFTGCLTSSGLVVKNKALKDYFGDRKPDIGIGTSSSNDHLFISSCKVCLNLVSNVVYACLKLRLV